MVSANQSAISLVLVMSKDAISMDITCHRNMHAI